MKGGTDGLCLYVWERKLSRGLVKFVAKRAGGAFKESHGVKLKKYDQTLELKLRSLIFSARFVICLPIILLINLQACDQLIKALKYI